MRVSIHQLVGYLVRFLLIVSRAQPQLKGVRIRLADLQRPTPGTKVKRLHLLQHWDDFIQGKPCGRGDQVRQWTSPVGPFEQRIQSFGQSK